MLYNRIGYTNMSFFQTRRYSQFYGQSGNLLANALSKNPLFNTNIANPKIGSAQNFTSTASVEASKLRKTLVNLLGKGSGSVFNNSAAVSSDTNVLRIKSSSTKTLSDTTVFIDQVATTQKNEGTALNAKASAPANNTYRFEIEVDGKKHQLSFSTDKNETNESFQQKMAEAINKANIGVTASVTTNKGNSTLSIETKTTGAGKDGEPRFNIKDISGDAVTRTGVSNIAQEAQDAAYSVNGGEKQTSKSNDIDLRNGVTVTLVKASDKAVTISLGKDTQAMQNAVRDMVNSYNKMLEAARGNQSDKITKMFIYNLERLASSSKSSLKEIGVEINANGYLSVDSTKMNAAAENGKMEKFFVGDGKSTATGSNFTRQLQKVADDLNRNPNQFIDPALSRVVAANSYAAAYGINGYSTAQLTSMLLDILN